MYLIAFLATFLYLAVLWVIVLTVYNLILEPFDFGPLGIFAAKSALLLAIMSGLYLVPYASWFALVFWWIGLMVIFKKDFWECRVLVVLIWGIGFIGRLFLSALLLPE